MSVGRDFVRFLLSQRHRCDLAESLGADPDHVYAYYLCAATLLPRIISEGIRCRNDPARRTRADLSAPSVQQRRHTVWVSRPPDRLRDKPVHDCVNLFWNPLNNTFKAFQRNALLSACESARFIGPGVCLLEVDAQRILEDNKHYWCATNKNIAKDAFNSSNLAQLTSEQYFPWENIFDPTRSDKDSIDRRAAELVLFSPQENKPFSVALPPEFIRRIIVHAMPQASGEVAACIGAFQSVSCIPEIFESVDDLLKYEAGCLKSLVEIRHKFSRGQSEVAEGFCLALQWIVEFDERMPVCLASELKTDKQRYGWHGIEYITRVTFWAAFL